MTLAVRWLALCAAAAFVCGPRPAHAQGSDTLPTLDDSENTPATPPTDPGPPPPAVVVLDPSQKPARLPIGPVRAQRRLALLGEVGWNGIAGFGPNLTYRMHPHVSVDLGAGLSLVGWKIGVRGRYLFMKGPVTPFIGAGVIAAAGFGSQPIRLNEDDPSREPLNIKIRPSSWLQMVAGLDWVAPNGFTLIGSAGYAKLLSDDPVEITSGTPNDDEKQAFDVAFRSNVVITIALGYSFR